MIKGLTKIGIRDTSFKLFSVEELVDEGILEKPLDGNHGEIHPKSEDFVSEGIPFIMASDIRGGRVDYTSCSFITERQANGLRKGFARNGDVLVTHKATIGETALVSYNVHPFVMLTPQVTYYRVKDKRRLNQFYLLWYFRSSLFQQTLSLWASSGATRGYLGITEQRRLPIVMPPIEKQKKIAAVLMAYDDMIAINQRLIAALEKTAEEIYREWFVRLRFPGYERTKLVKGRPETWTEDRFGNFCVLQRGFDLPDAEVVHGPYPIIASTSIKGFHHEFKVQPPVVTTGRSGSLGEVLMVHTPAWPLNTALYVKDFCGNSPFLVYYTLKNMGLENFNAGAGVPSLNRNHLAGIKLNVPDRALQESFDKIVGPMHQQKEELVKMNDALHQTRDLLLLRLISGKLRVDDLDIQFPPSMEELLNEAS